MGRLRFRLLLVALFTASGTLSGVLLVQSAHGTFSAPSIPTVEITSQTVIASSKSVIELPNCVRFYVPGTLGGQPAPEMQTQWSERSLRRFSELFGGATAIRAEGAWADGATLVREPVIIVYSHTTADSLASHRADVLDLASQLRSEMKQDSVAVEFDGTLLLVSN